MFVDWKYVAEFFSGKTVAVVCSGPSCLDNDGKFIDSHDIVIRVNNYKIKGFENHVGKKTDVVYSFWGLTGFKKSRELAIKDGVKLCMCKCPDSQPIDSEWHRKHNKMAGIDFRYIYKLRKEYWFCPTYIPTDERFIEHFNFLGGHIPTTGFSCLLELIKTDCKSIYLTGFDGFRSGTHNIDEKHVMKNNDDPIKHVPEKEIDKLAGLDKRILFDKNLEKIICGI